MTEKTKKYVYQLLHYPKKGDRSGHFVSATPGDAAEKMMYKLYKHHQNENPQMTDSSSFLIFKFINTETLKEYCYLGKVIQLDQPVIQKLKDGREIQYKHRTIVAPMNPFFLVSQIKGIDIPPHIEKTSKK